MTVQLHIAKSGAKHAPTLPLDAVTSTFAVLGQRGTGKTNTAVVIVEEMAKRGAHVAILDPVGAWWGITHAGERKGMEGIVLGGEHGDVPLEETGGQLVAELVIGRHWPVVVIDLKMLRKGAQLRFMADYLEALFHGNREPLHQVFEEADRALPQMLRSSSDAIPAARVLGAGEDIVKLGRSRGLGATLVTQRPATLNKNVLEVCESLILHRLMGPNDRKAVRGWVEANGDERALKQVMDSMASLQRGEAWLYSPGWLRLLEKIRLRGRHTFDSSATPEVGQAMVEPTERAPVDLDELRERMSETVERARANDPAELRKQLVALEREYESLQGQLDERPAEPVRVVVPDKAAMASLSESIAALHAALDEMAEDERLWREREERFLVAVAERQQVWREVLQRGEELLNGAAALPRDGATLDSRLPASGFEKRAARTANRDSRIMIREEAGPARSEERSSNGTASGKLQRILGGLAWWEAVGVEKVGRGRLAFVCGYHERTKSYTNGLSELSSAGLIDYPQPGLVALTPEGRAQAPAPDQPPTRAALHEMVFAQIGGRQGKHGRILSLAIDAYPEALSRAEIAERLDYHERTKSFTNGLSRLSSLGLVEYPQPGYVAATELLFPAIRRAAVR